MSDRPIIFSAPMVLVLLDGRKTMTRRLAGAYRPVYPGAEELVRKPSPWQKVQPGDRLWVRESFAVTPDGNPVYAATEFDGYASDCWEAGIKCKPSIHMPRWASRLTLVVTATKIEPLLDISEDDARAEGFADGQLDDGFGARDIGDGFTVESSGTWASAAGMFQITWATLHPDWDGWSSPEVVALTFTVHRTNIDAMERTDRV